VGWRGETLVHVRNDGGLYRLQIRLTIAAPRPESTYAIDVCPPMAYTSSMLVSVVETDSCLSKARKIMSEAEMEAVALMISGSPVAGDVIQGTSGLRKLRIPLLEHRAIRCIHTTPNSACAGRANACGNKRALIPLRDLLPFARTNGRRRLTIVAFSRAASRGRRWPTGRMRAPLTSRCNCPPYPAILLWVFAKNEASDLSPSQKKQLVSASDLFMQQVRSVT
jgi:hypothetical protein